LGGKVRGWRQASLSKTSSAADIGAYPRSFSTKAFANRSTHKLEAEANQGR
jgi:hypothetical protein